MRKFFLTACVALTLAACGYKPLYQEQASALREVSIGTIRMNDVVRNVGERRAAQHVRQQLALTLPQSGGIYRLDMVLEEIGTSLAQRRDATDVRRQLVLEARINMVNAEGESVWTYTSSAKSAYNVEDSPFGADAGRDYARETAARNLAQEVIHELARALKTNAVEAN